MADLGSYCVDRWELHAVDQAGRRLSPHYPIEPRLLRFAHDYWSVERMRVGPERARALALPELPEYQRGAFTARAASAPGVLPQGYLSYPAARRACEAAGKRLCSEDEWVRACRGPRGTRHPYGDAFEAGRCNVARAVHPAYELHGNSSVGHLDPRLHLVIEEGRVPLLEQSGARARCASPWPEPVFDMVGNLDEWIEDASGTFVGGFYARGTREGCEAKIDSHGPTYADYSLGARCCKTP